MKILFFLIFLFSNIFSQINVSSWSYKKNFLQDEIGISSNKIIISKTLTPCFNQLIFSWNSFRPDKGYFSFFVQPYFSKNKKYGSWYKMYDWGNNIQKSYSNIKKNKISYIHVRLELPKEKLADGFNIKIESHNGADLSLIKNLNVCISNFSLFKNETISKEILKLPSIKINDVPKKSQMILDHEHNKKMCSPTATSMLISYLLKQKINPIHFALKAYDHGLKAFGSWPFNIAHAFEICPDYNFSVKRLNSFSELYSYLAKNIPVVVSVRGKMKSAPQPYNDGHLILVIGWDQKSKKVIVHDPAFDNDMDVEHKYPIVSFLRAWEKSNRLAYIAEKR